MKNPDRLQYIKLHDDLFWAASCQGFAFGPLLNDYRVPDLGTEFISKGDMKSIFDTASNTIQMPPAIFDDYLEALIVTTDAVLNESYVDGQGVYVNCNAEFPSLFFMFDQTWLEVEPQHYVRDVSAEQDASECLLLL